ncbi:hypothetical protein [Olsenella sp. oral taxon 809]|uniref:hypothetical protein n=1 Tax=Olsenella sp. oral taxon 809 TaxID=661086 RepID=UPI000231EDDA|nr:hypothetical protein [Olsenella sp. oral taxon 809]EHF01946.1 hypothetical protein HMPREF1008_01041 [Olsenella sp. oral taxon 809 str. F0356]
MGQSGQITIVPDSVDDIVAMLRSLADDAAMVTAADYSLTLTTGSGGQALEGVGRAIGACATALSGTLSALADDIAAAKADFQGADFEAARRNARIGEPSDASPLAAGGGTGGGSSW